MRTCPPRIAVAALLAPLSGLPACASGEMSVALDLGGEGVAVTVLGDGFVRSAGERMPLEGFVLRLRQRLRALPEAGRQALWVKIGVDRTAGPDAGRDVDRLLDELKAMGVPQVVLE